MRQEHRPQGGAVTLSVVPLECCDSTAGKVIPGKVVQSGAGKQKDVLDNNIIFITRFCRNVIFSDSFVKTVRSYLPLRLLDLVLHPPPFLPSPYSSHTPIPPIFTICASSLSSFPTASPSLSHPNFLQLFLPLFTSPSSTSRSRSFSPPLPHFPVSVPVFHVHCTDAKFALTSEGRSVSRGTSASVQPVSHVGGDSYCRVNNASV